MPGTSGIALAGSLAALAVILGACGGDDEPPTTATTTSTTTTTTTTGPTGTDTAGCAAGQDGSAFIDKSSGEFEGLAPDCRQGTMPAPPDSTDLEEVAGAADCDLELDLPDEGNNHIPRSEQTRYDTAPPTSGDHDATPLADGAYLDPPEPRYFVHSMEHGRVLIAYQPDLAEGDQLALKGLFEEDPDGMILFPYADMPYEVAATAWSSLLGCGSYSSESLDAIRAFREEFRGNGPEAIPL